MREPERVMAFIAVGAIMKCLGGMTSTHRVNQMNIGLYFRNVDIRLHVAYMADAYYGGFETCKPANTAERLYESIADDKREGDHPYSKMWGKIQSWYDVNKLYECSEREIEEMFKVWCATGFKDSSGQDRTGLDLMNAKKRWEDRLWKRYEEKRNGRRKVARSLAFLPLLALGVDVGGEG